MSAETLDIVGELNGHQDAIDLHFAAQRVLEAAHHGGRGGFRVDHVNDRIITNLPEYIAGFEGKRFPKFYYGERGEIVRGGGTTVKSSDSMISLDRTWVDEDSGEQRAWFKWNTQTWTGTTDVVPEPIAKSNKYKRIIRPIGVAVMVATNVVGMGLMLKGFHDEANAQRAPIPNAANISKAHSLENAGIDILFSEMVVGSVLATGMALKLLREENTKQVESVDSSTPPT